MSVSMYLDYNVANASMNERPRIVTTLTHTAKFRFACANIAKKTIC